METVTPKFIGDSTNYMFAGTGEMRAMLQTILQDIKKAEVFRKGTEKTLVGIISSNLMKKIQNDIRKNVLSLPAYQRESGATKNTILNELVSRCLHLTVEADHFKSDTCLLKKSDLIEAGVPIVDFGKLVTDINEDWGKYPHMTWGFCAGKPGVDNVSEPYIWVGLAFGTKV